MLEVVILLMTYLIEYAFQIKKYFNIHVFNMTTGKNESKIVTKDISCECRFDGKNVIQINGGIRTHVDECQKHHVCEKYYIWNPATCSCKNGKYSASIMDDSEVMCDEFINAEAKSNSEETKTILTNFNEKYNFVKHKISIFYLPFY